MKFIVDAQLPRKLSSFLIEKGYDTFKLIYLTVGNISTIQLLEIFEKNYKKIITEIQVNSVVEITNTSIITIL